MFLWRHLAHWPALLVLTQANFMPLKATGEINAVAAGMVDLAAKEGARMGGSMTGSKVFSIERVASLRTKSPSHLVSPAWSPLAMP